VQLSRPLWGTVYSVPCESALVWLAGEGPREGDDGFGLSFYSPWSERSGRLVASSAGARQGSADEMVLNDPSWNTDQGV